MGHMVGKDVYGALGNKLDNLHVKSPYNQTMHSVLKELFSEAEADLFVKMPYLFSNLDRVSRITKISTKELEPLLKGMCEKGLVMDIWLDGQYRYMPSPLFVGVFEFTMMRTKGQLNVKQWADLFHEYMHEGAPYRSNFAAGTQTSIARAVPHPEALGDHVEILDYEKVGYLVDEAKKYSVGLCSCRHKKEHSTGGRCDVPMETCTTLGHGAEYIIRNGLGREIDKAEMIDILQRSRDLGLVFSADNVQKRLMFICHCCGCCCGIMDGINVHGLPNALVTSSFIAQVDNETCNGCGKCVAACPINAIELQDAGVKANGKPQKLALVDHSVCLGCGVCSLKCPSDALKLDNRSQRVIHPETTFQRVILQCLERDTLQNQLFDDPQSLTHKVMRPLVGGFLKLSPVKKALMSDALRSTFLKSMGAGINILGKGYLHEL